jgi:hypothetical protein
MAGGRPKGSTNLESKIVKEMVFEALNNAGGAAYLTRQAEANPSAFMTMVGKLLPKDVNVGGQDGENPLIAEVRRVIVDKCSPSA